MHIDAQVWTDMEQFPQADSPRDNPEFDPPYM